MPDKPKRRLTAYNIFFTLVRQRILRGDDDKPITPEEIADLVISRENEDKPRRRHRKTHGKISFANLACTIAGKWKELDPDIKRHFEKRALDDKVRYLHERDRWHAQQRELEDSGEKEETTNDTKPPAAALPLDAAAHQQADPPVKVPPLAVIVGNARHHPSPPPLPAGQTIYQEAFPALSVTMNPGIVSNSVGHEAVPTYLPPEEQFWLRCQLQREHQQEHAEAAQRCQLKTRPSGLATERQFLNINNSEAFLDYTLAGLSGNSGRLSMEHQWGSSSLPFSDLVAMATRQAYLEGRESALRAQQMQLMRPAAAPLYFLPVQAQYVPLPSSVSTTGHATSGPSLQSPAAAVALWRQLHPPQIVKSEQRPRHDSAKRPPPGAG